MFHFISKLKLYAALNLKNKGWLNLPGISDPIKYSEFLMCLTKRQTPSLGHNFHPPYSKAISAYFGGPIF